MFIACITTTGFTEPKSGIETEKSSVIRTIKSGFLHLKDQRALRYFMLANISKYLMHALLTFGALLHASQFKKDGATSIITIALIWPAGMASAILAQYIAKRANFLSFRTQAGYRYTSVYYFILIIAYGLTFRFGYASFNVFFVTF